MRYALGSEAGRACLRHDYALTDSFLYPILMSVITDLLARFSALEAKLNTLVGRSSSIQIATVTNNNDPQNLRRIRVSTETQGGVSQSYWVQTGRSQTHTDEPLPPINSTVLIACCQGDPHDMYVLRTICNDRNPPDPRQNDPIIDHSSEIQGSEYKNVTGDRSHQIRGDETIEVGGNLSIQSSGGSLKVRSDMGRLDISALDTITIRCDSGSSISLLASGAIVLQDGAGRTLTLPGLVGSPSLFDLNGTAINVINANGFTINSVSVATVGALDSRGDTLVNRGW